MGQGVGMGETEGRKPFNPRGAGSQGAQDIALTCPTSSKAPNRPLLLLPLASLLSALTSLS